MAILNIRLVPDPILFRKARKVAKITNQHKKLSQNMVETMNEHHGVGLAANQVGVLERICVIQTPDMEDAIVLVNPEIVQKEGQREVEEGCLSVPGYRGMVVRSEKVRVRALDLSSKPLKVDAEGDILAQALEHEIDHLNGIMYMDHLAAHTTLYQIQETAEGEEGAEEHTHEHAYAHSEPGHPTPAFDSLHRRLHAMNLGESGANESNKPAAP